MCRNFARRERQAGRSDFRTTAMACFFACLVSALSLPLWAGTTGSTELLTIQGAGAARSQGDYVSDGGGLGTYYSFYIEVPPSASRLVIDIFDANIDDGEASTGRDEFRGGGTAATYSVRNPLGVVQTTDFSTGDASGPASSDNAWLTLFDSDTAGGLLTPSYEDHETDTEGSGDTSITVSIPADGPCAAGDLLVAFVGTDGTTSIGTPTGWTEIDQETSSLGSGGEVTLAAFYTTATSGGGGNLGTSETFSWSGGQEAVGGILCYSDVDVSDPIDIFATDDGFSNSPDAPSATTTVDNTRVIRVYAADDDDLDGTPYPGGHDGRFNEESNSGGGTVSLGVADTTQATAGATGVAEFALDTFQSEQWVTMTIALQGEDLGTPDLLPGHWEVRVDQSGTGGDDINAIGIRAHDGTSGAGGVELNLYAESYMTYGTNNEDGSTFTRDYTHHPYITSGCDLGVLDFDFDATNSGTEGDIDFTHAGGGGVFASVVDADLSGNDVWAENTVSSWTTSEDAINYGIWDMDVQISGFTGGNGNYGQILLENDQGAGADPDTQPEPASFDIYIPTDGGSAPVKPYLEQAARWKTGPNPPDNGQTTTITVTVRLVNPTPHSITFSASNLVTANVPGSGVVYGGDPQVSQGTVVSQPSIGGTGNITWNPGTVTTGSTELLSYDVNVTPTSNGQTLVVTGTPASNGTTARYVDETCTGASPACSGAQLSRATPTLGPLCQLSVTENALTYVKIDRFDSYTSRDGLVVEWESASEAGTMSYELWRAEGDEWVPVKGGQVPALFGAPQGGVYRVVDPDGGAGAYYVVVEHDRRGETSTHGPFEAAPVRSLAAEMPSSVTAEALVIPAPTRTRVLEEKRGFENQTERGIASDPEAFGVYGGDRGPTGRQRAPLATKVIVRDSGLYLLDSTQIAGALGRPVAWIENQIGKGGFRLTNAGTGIAWTAAAGNSGLYFYGEAIDSLYTRDNVYVLTAASGTTMTTFPWLSGTPDRGATYAAHDRQEVDSLAALVLGLDPESDYWFWAGLTAGTANFDTWTTTIPVSALGTGSAELSVSVLGATLSGAGGEHEADLFLNGNYLTTASWTGAEHTVTVPLSTSDLVVGDNTVSLQALLPNGASESFVFVDRAELVYERHYSAVGDELSFSADGNGVVTLDGFSGSVILLDITNPQQPRLATGTSGTTFQPPGGAGSFLAVGSSAVREPIALLPLSDRNLLATAADDIFLVPADIEHSVDELMAHREDQGLTTLRVTLDQVMDQFNHGIFDPRAIRSFLIAAEAQWGSAPDYLTLVGAGHYDYRDLYGAGGQLMPPLLTATENGLYANDDAYGDLDGDGVADLSVGRIPATDYFDMWRYSQKVIAYEAAGAGSNILLISDGQRPGEALDFAGESDVLAAGFGDSANVSQLDLGTLGIENLRTEMFGGLAAGPAFVNYFGHGAADVWSDSAILTLTDLPGLTGPPAVYTGLTCLMNRFEVTGFESLGAGLLFAEGGAVASWSPTAPEAHAVSRVLGERFYQRIQNHDWSQGGLILGDLVREIRSSGAAGQGPESLGTYLLMGDPALRLRFGRIPGPPPTPGEVE
ncbi:MAG: hypothetical protein K8J08_07560 [Thermoanaerobaculia bacterium]|nr:hypothetical protein [Thermoanaerobaculia bacterium]